MKNEKKHFLQSMKLTKPRFSYHFTKQELCTTF